ncbi:MAG: hypothetical protein K9M45_05650 [Kiritimatiellales bacterium]|nr:hypothetical protein [Kiritimatiellales bacterium]
MAGSETPWEVDGQWAKIRRGWCFGGDAFRERMLKEIDKAVAGKRRDSFSGEEVLRHDLQAAESLIDGGLEKLELSRKELAELPKGDFRKQVFAWIVRRRTVVRNEWISQTLCMGSPARLSAYLREVELAKTGELARLKGMFKC